MKLSANDKFELKAKAFEKMRYVLAPGKDQPSPNAVAREIREREWCEWNNRYGVVCKHLISAIEELL